MGSVTAISKSKELERFFDYLYGDQEGYVYSPVKNVEVDDSWEQHFFYWPTEKDKLIRHVQYMSGNFDVYTGPALYSSPSGKEEAFKGSHFVWAEFDGNALEASIKLSPELHPTFRVQSSVSGHEHWYWRLEGFITDFAVIQSINKRLAYALDADLGCWNPNRVLRPPTTTHHESEETVTWLREGAEVTPITAFISLPEVSLNLMEDDDLGILPMAIEVINKYNLTSKDLEFFLEKQMPTEPGKSEGAGYRSSALAKLCHICIEQGMNNAETLSLLLSANNRWGKWKSPKRARRQLIKLINNCRSQPQHAIDPVKQEAALKFKVYTFAEFDATKIEPDWIYPGLLHSKGILCLTGPPGVGKSTVTLRFCESMVIGDKFLKWTPKRPARVLLVSMEMPHEELAHFTKNMRLDANHERLSEDLLIMPLGHSIQLRNKESQNHLRETIEKFQPEGILFDSFGVGIGGDMSSDQIVLEVMGYFKETIIGEYGCFVWFIHHNRKPQPGNRKPNKLEDMYGSTYIAGESTSVVGLWGKPGSNTVEVDCLKLRMMEHFKSFKMKRTPSMNFEVMENLLESRDEGRLLPKMTADKDDAAEDEFDLGDTI